MNKLIILFDNRHLKNSKGPAASGKTLAQKKFAGGRGGEREC